MSAEREIMEQAVNLLDDISKGLVEFPDTLATEFFDQYGESLIEIDDDVD